VSTDLNTNEKCPACGQPIAAGAKFCRACGTPAGEPVRLKEAACPSCGAQTAVGAKFCRGCGKPISQTPRARKMGEKCPSCGTARGSGAKFCKACGFRFEAAQPVPPKDSAVAFGAEPQALMPKGSAPGIVGVPLATGNSSEPEARGIPQTVCPTCGSRQTTAKAFCRNCGTRLVPAEMKVPAPAPPARSTAESVPGPATISTTETSSIVRCGACGAEVPAGKEFCRRCGAPVGSTARAAATAPSVMPVSTKRSAPSVTMPPTLRVTAKPVPAEAQIPTAGPAIATSLPAQRRPALVAAVIVACVALLGGGGFLAYRHFRASRQAPQTGNATAQAAVAATQSRPSQGPSSPATQATPPSTAPAQTREMPSPSVANSGNSEKARSTTLGATASFPPSQPTPAFQATPSTPSSGPGGEGLGEAGGIAGPAVQVPATSSAGIAAPATNASGQAAAGVAGSAVANTGASTTAPTYQPSVTPAAPPPPPQAVQPAIPSSGTLTWSGHLGKNALVTIQGHSASSGSLQGQLPGVPVIIQVDPSDVGVAEAPGPQNSWKRVVLRSNKSRNIVVRIEWRRLQY